jgi:hypothetical protein
MKRNIYLIISSITLLIGLSLVIFFSDLQNLRGYFGDFLIVIFLFCCLKSVFIRLNSIVSGIFILSFSIFIEILQYFEISKYFDNSNIIFQIIIGSTFDFLDILMYLSGTLVIVIIDKKVIENY